MSNQKTNNRLSKVSKDSHSKTPQNDQFSKKLKQFLNSTPFSLFMSVLTIYTIFAIDVNKAFFVDDADVIFSCVHIVSMLIFVIEIFVLSRIESGYTLGFYFWIDVFSTLTMVLELIWIEDFMNQQSNVQVAISFTRVSKISRFSKIGARSTKILKLIRLIKLMKFIKDKKEEQKNIVEDELNNEEKQYVMSQMMENRDVKFVSAVKSNAESINDGISQSSDYNINGLVKRPNVDPELQLRVEEMWEAQSEENENKHKYEELSSAEKTTKVGQILRHEIQKNIVIMVMALIIIVPLLSADTWYTKVSEFQFDTSSYLSLVLNSTDLVKEEWVKTFINTSMSSSNPVIYFQFQGYLFPERDRLNISTVDDLPDVDDLRKSEITSISDSDSDIKFSKKQQTTISAYISIGRSFFVTLLLILASVFFIQDLQNYALIPLEKMNRTVQKIEKNPFSVIEDCMNEESEESLQSQIKGLEEQLQTNILQKLLIKITGLLALGIGETPSKLTTAEGDEVDRSFQLYRNDDPCVEVTGIFMVIQVAHLQKLIKYLQGETALYISNILQTFHEVVIENGGFIFHQDQTYSMVCWKTNPVKDSFISSRNIQAKIDEKRKSELLFLAYAKFCEKIQQTSLIKKYEYIKEVIPDFPLYKINVGIHCGVAYCGTIGSSFKFSLRAMGRDVSIARSLCRAAQKFRVGNLFSSTLFKQCSPYIQNYSRKVDEYSFIELENYFPVELQIYTVYSSYDFHTDKISNDTSRSLKYSNEVKQRKKMINLFKSREEVLGRHRLDDMQMLSKTAIKKYSNVEEWLDLWRDSQNFYEEGLWSTAKVGFENSKEICPYPKDSYAELRIKQMKNREEPSPNWKKTRNISLFL